MLTRQRLRLILSESETDESNMIQPFEGGKGGSRSRFTENKKVLSQFTKNKIGNSRFTEKMKTFFFKQKLDTVTF